MFLAPSAGMANDYSLMAPAGCLRSKSLPPDAWMLSQAFTATISLELEPLCFLASPLCVAGIPPSRGVVAQGHTALLHGHRMAEDEATAPTLSELSAQSVV